MKPGIFSHSRGGIFDIEAAGEIVNVWLDGDSANAIVFVHGNSACKEVFYRQFDAFTGLRYKLVALDLPGHGASPDAVCPEKTYNICGYANLIKEALVKLRIVRPVVVGWSLGGHIAIELAGQGMDLQGIVLSGTPPAGPGGAEMAEAFSPSPHMAITMKEDATKAEMMLYAQNLYKGLEDIPPYFIDCALRTDGRARRLAGEHWVSGGQGHHQKSVVANWPQPICVIQGADEPFFSNDYLKRLSWGNLWRREIAEIPAAGHAPFLEAAPAYNAVLSAFLSSIFTNQ